VANARGIATIALRIFFVPCWNVVDETPASRFFV
jgi:hypothetical protein